METVLMFVSKTVVKLPWVGKRCVLLAYIGVALDIKSKTCTCCCLSNLGGLRNSCKDCKWSFSSKRMLILITNNSIHFIIEKHFPKVHFHTSITIEHQENRKLQFCAPCFCQYCWVKLWPPMLTNSIAIGCRYQKPIKTWSTIQWIEIL